MIDVSPLTRNREDETRLAYATQALSTRVFDLRELLSLPLLFVAIIVLLNFGLKAINSAFFDSSIKVDATWPVSVFYSHFLWEPVALFAATIVAAVVLFAGLTWVVITSDTDGVLPAVVGGAVLVLATTLVQGIEPGFVGPIAGSYVADYGAPGIQNGIQYYHQALQVADPLAFVSTYVANQPDMVMHARTHPPGAVLTFYFLNELLGSPALISVAIVFSSVAISGIALYRLLAAHVARPTAQFTTFLYFLLPSIQVYYGASLDALVVSFLLAGTYLFTQRQGALGVVGAIVCFFLASFQTFTFLFILPVIAGYELIQRRTLKRTILVVGSLGAIYGLLYLSLDFNYLQSFFTASRLENGDGMQLFVQPAEYVVTRMEGVVEILVFLTPFLTWLLIRERTYFARRADLSVLSTTAVLTLGLMLLAGFFQTGETARGAMFVYPFLFLPLASYFDDLWLTRWEQGVLAVLVFGQALAMQVVGFYFW